MSPARSRRQSQVVHRRDRGEIVKSVLVSAGIVAVTAVIIWMLRPGPPGVPATGGIMNRQPRASWLVFGAIVAGVTACWFVLRGSPRARRRAKVVLPIALVIVLLGAIGIGFAWPGGLLRHDVAPSAQPPPTTTTAPATTSTAPSTTTKPAGATATTAPASTTAQAPTQSPTTLPR
jgi:hypothetical protein